MQKTQKGRVLSMKKVFIFLVFLLGIGVMAYAGM
jgi:hypothetical protein